MKGGIYFSQLFLLLFIFTSCRKEPELDNDLWMGTTRVMDRNIPFPFLMERTENGFHLIDHKNQLIDSINELPTNYNPMDTIKMQDHQFLVLKGSPNFFLFDLRDSVNFPYQHPLYAAQFVKTENSKGIRLSTFLKNLQKNTYQTEVESAHFATPNRDLKVVKTINFSEETLQTIFTYYYQNEPVYAEKEMAKYDIFERKGKLFFSKDQEPDKPQTLYQISRVDDNSFSLRTFRNNEEITELLEISDESKSTRKLSTFKRCMEGQPGEYYHDNLTYVKGNEYLIRKISKNAPEASGDGYITVHFTLNCKGKIGNPGLEQMDLEFQSTSFNAGLVQHIITEVMNLKDWPEIKPGIFYKDIHSFLMFRIKNGKIIDLCP